MQQSPFKGRSGLARISKALGYSRDGLVSAWLHESAFRQELLLAAVMTMLAFLLPVTMFSRALMLGSLLLVLIVELLNSAIEAVVDRVSVEHHPLSKRAKDLGSAAVLISLVNVVVVWSLLLVGEF